MSWRPATGEDLAVPCGNVIKVFSRGIWTLAHSLEAPEQNKVTVICPKTLLQLTEMHDSDRVNW